MRTVRSMTIARLTDAAIADLAATLPHWRAEGGRLHRGFKFKDFRAAWGFMARMALLAEAQDHHPDWSNSFDKVTIALTTHEAGGLTARDVRLAQAIDALV